MRRALKILAWIVGLLIAIPVWPCSPCWCSPMCSVGRDFITATIGA